MCNSNKIIIVAGYGPGISRSVAIKFGKQGYKVALDSRTQSRLDDVAKELSSEHQLDVKGFAIDLADPVKTVAGISTIRDAFGPDAKIKILQWNVYSSNNNNGRQFAEASLAGMVEEYNLLVGSLWLAIQAITDDLEEMKGAVLVTSGGLSLYSERCLNAAVRWGSFMPLVAKAAEWKLVQLAHVALEPKGIYVGEVVVRDIAMNSAVTKTKEAGTVHPDDIADLFVAIEKKRDTVVAEIGSTF
ncbi:hypothetical protein HDU93_005228 [Gonapodya sp. JEL0774]|nr:hypothetical protein HDU93_005228 [Gonapodya sp. JEL0774]